MSPSRYIIISPVRNEEPNLERTIHSVSRQSVLPDQWIIVNDGSSDRTPKIIDDAAAKFPWITAVHRKDRGARKSGAGVMEAFYDGFKQVAHPDWECLVKLDGDLEFEPDYFEKVLQVLGKNQKLGITGGDICHWQDGSIVIESKDDPVFHVRGATKVYRRECWDAIGGLFSVTGWDTLDEVKANMIGWETWRIPELQLIHLRPTGGADGSWKNGFKNGRGSYIAGYHPLYLVAKCIRRFFRWPMSMESPGLLCGFFSGYLKRTPRIEDPALVKFMRDHQLRRLLGRPSLWR